jgi:hypothetical protein
VSQGVDDIAPMLRQLGSRLSLATFALGMSVCAAILLSGKDPTVYQGVPLLAIACVLLAALAWTVLWWWHFVGLGRRVRLEPLMKFFKR